MRLNGVINVRGEIRKKVERKRAKGEILTGVRKYLEEVEVTELNVNETAVLVYGVHDRRLRVEGEIWIIMTKYNGVKMKEIKKSIEKKIEELEKEILCIRGEILTRESKMRKADGKEKKTGIEREMQKIKQLIMKIGNY